MEFSESKIMQAAFFNAGSFLHKRHAMLGNNLLTRLLGDISLGVVNVIREERTGTDIYYRFLAWDSEYFGIATYRVELMCSEVKQNDAVDAYTRCLSELSECLTKTHEDVYLFAELPSESICPIQAVCLSKWRMVETRLTYYNDHLKNYEYARRFPVRSASYADIPNLRNTAVAARNNYDRFHADYYFSEHVADEFIATFIEQSVRGLADITLVPDSDESDPEAFLTANILPFDAAASVPKMARMVLSAVGEKRRGWYVKLISEMSYLFKDMNIDVAYMTTQSTNKAVIRTWEKLGYSFGKSSHIFVCVV
jgi:dTDP-4-amino-4,6-dideoxy-D-galactose acyltransferase